jgi:hypothetical protein
LSAALGIYLRVGTSYGEAADLDVTVVPTSLPILDYTHPRLTLYNGQGNQGDVLWQTKGSNLKPLKYSTRRYLPGAESNLETTMLKVYGEMNYKCWTI